MDFEVVHRHLIEEDRDRGPLRLRPGQWASAAGNATCDSSVGVSTS